jgi:hypothetical protein
MRKSRLRMVAWALALVVALAAPSAFALSGGTNISVQNGQVSITGQIAVGNGGTGAATLTAHGVVLGNGTSAVAVTSAGTAGQPLLSGGASADPSFGALDISTSAVTGTLPIARGGTNATSFTTSRCLRFDGTSIVSAAADCGTSINPVVPFGSGMDVTTSQTVFLGLSGSIDTTEAVVTVPSPAATYKNLRCNNGAVQGVGNDVTFTARVGACGSLSDGTLTCTITGTAGANQGCNDTTNNAAPTAGQCISVKAVTPAALTANARLGCVVERTA